MTKTTSIEILHHFSCESCHRWWSISDLKGELDVMYCPYCGYKILFSTPRKRPSWIERLAYRLGFVIPSVTVSDYRDGI